MKKRSRNNLMARYGLTDLKYERLVLEQGGVCAICHQPETRLYRGITPMGLSVDHVDREEGPVVRALLCHACNLALGFLRDDPVRARAAADYLEAHRG